MKFNLKQFMMKGQTMLQASAGNRPLPIPPTFPVAWDDPGDVELLWGYSPAYYPKPLLPLEFAVGALPPLVAGNRVLARYGVPVETQTRLINGYPYSANRWLGAPPMTGERGAGEWGERETIALIRQLRQRWEEEWLPEIKSHLTAWQAVDFSGAPWPALLTQLDESMARVDRLQELHIEVGLIFFIAIQHFESWLQNIFVSATGEKVDAYTLLAGFESTGAQSSQTLWQLSRSALMQPEVYWVLRECPPAQALTALQDSDEGQEFFAELQSYLQAYGYQGDKNYLSHPTWQEEPTPVLHILRGYLAQSTRNLADDLHATATRREAALATVRVRLAALPNVDCEHFEFLLKCAQEATWLREEHPHWLDLRIYATIRHNLVAVGQRFVQAGLLAAPADIFYLTLDEVRATLRHSTARQELVVQRRALYQQYAAYTPPTLLGSIPAQPMPNHPLLAAMAQNSAELPVTGPTPRANGPTAPALPAAPGQTLRGHAASAGCVRGRARLLASPAEAGRLHVGDILVTVNTTPSWTSLYANIAGLVTDAGGILSHAAVVAREFGIPAVVGTRAATTLIKEGQLIEVNGSEGVVKLMESR
ncbi:MAG: PEP-utilizing enzyme [Caldilineaceae bacterium]